jgi:hypothetical protein
MIGMDQIRAIRRIRFVKRSPFSLIFVIAYPPFFDSVQPVHTRPFSSNIPDNQAKLGDIYLSVLYNDFSTSYCNDLQFIYFLPSKNMAQNVAPFGSSCEPSGFGPVNLG